nr:uncharacterized protein LOC109149841 [Ipomoea trifida]
MFREIQLTQLKAATHARAHSRAKNATALARIAIAGGQASHPRLPLALCSAWSRAPSRTMISSGECIFVSVDEIISRHICCHMESLLAGAIAGPSLLLTGFDNQHTSLAIYILMRAAVLASVVE